uniref:Peptidase S1 domain-containing protein n=1 Tax=Anopheles christyi TaxID=43041 RepID=A0A182KE11_9DIPT
MSFLLLLLLLGVRSHQHTVQGEQECMLVNREGESKGVLVPASQCTTFQPDNKASHLTHTEQLVCCAVFQSEPNCGRISQYASEFSFDSRETQLDQFPWAAMVLMRRVQKIVCSGSLIGSRYVLSAAHCYVDVHGASKPATDYRVRLGDWDLGLEEDCLYVRGQLVCNDQQPVDYAVERIISHGDFQRQRRDYLHDIALLKLAETVECSMQVGPVCLPNWSVKVPEIAGQNFTVIGWGRTRSYSGIKRKFKLEMKGRNISACVRAYGLRASEVPRIHLCVGGLPRRDVCHGDSGGALMRRESSRWVLVGIVSFGAHRCGKPLPGVYTNVAQYIHWIQWAIGKASS